MRSTLRRAGREVKKMKQYTYKHYGGNGEYKHGYRKTGKKKTEPYYKQTTLPWKNSQKSIRST
jgi:hypothetical protein